MSDLYNRLHKATRVNEAMSVSEIAEDVKKAINKQIEFLLRTDMDDDTRKFTLSTDVGDLVKIYRSLKSGNVGMLMKMAQDIDTATRELIPTRAWNAILKLIDNWEATS